MNLAKFENALKIGETAAIEFKRAGGTIEMDTFETVCSFSNRFGGDIYLGVLVVQPHAPRGACCSAPRFILNQKFSSTARKP